MANEQFNQDVALGQQVRQLLPQLIQAGIAGGKKNIQSAVQNNPLATLSRLLGAASATPPQQLKPEVKAVFEARQKEIEKGAKEHVKELISNGADPVILAQQNLEAATANGLTSITDTSNKQGISNVPTSQSQQENVSQPSKNTEEQSNLLKDIGKFLFQPGGIDDEGVAKPAKLLGGLIQETASNVLLRQQTQALTPKAKQSELLVKTQLDFLKENFKQDRLDQREVLKNDLKSKIDKGEGITIGEVSDNISDFITTWDSLATGPVRGNLTALLSKLGPGNKGLANLKSMSEIMVFTLGGFFTGQTGRAFSDRDREIIGDALKVSVRTKAQDVIGKFNSAINFTNAKIKSQGGNQLLPNAQTMIKNVRAGLDPITGGQRQQGIQQTQPGTQGVTASGNTFKFK